MSRERIGNLPWLLLVGVSVLFLILIIGRGMRDSNSSHASGASTPAPTPLPPNAIGISIVTNDTKAEWLGIVTDEFNKKGVKTSAGHDVFVQMIQESSPDPTVKKIVAGDLQPTMWSPADISWVEQANRLLKEQEKPPVVNEECPRIVYAATGFMMWRPMAEALGWPDEPIGWKTIVDLAGDPQGWAKYGHPEWGQFKFGHTHPEQSSTGFNMLATLAYATAGKTKDLTPEDVWSPAVVAAFRKIERDTYHYGTSTRGLTTVMAQRGPGYLHAATSSETSMLKTAEVQKDVLRFPLAFVFPSEGVFWMDNPACVLDASWVSAEQREAASLYRDYLLGFEAQDKAVRIGLRPAAPNVPLHAPISLDNGTDPRVSPQTVPPLANVSAETQKAIIDVFKETKKRATVVLVLDRSGSMFGQKLDNALAASRNFVTRLGPNDRVHLFYFDSSVEYAGPNEDGTRDDVLKELNTIGAGSTTALNDALCAGVATAEADRKSDQAAGQQRLYGVALLTDGQENASKQKDVFTCLPTGEDVEGVKVFTIAYGSDADANLLKKIAERTNGKAFKGDPATIEQVYLAISAEQ
jgi:Ca-activated chloride channel family protein